MKIYIEKIRALRLTNRTKENKELNKKKEWKIKGKTSDGTSTWIIIDKDDYKTIRRKQSALCEDITYSNS